MINNYKYSYVTNVLLIIYLHINVIYRQHAIAVLCYIIVTLFTITK